MPQIKIFVLKIETAVLVETFGKTFNDHHDFLRKPKLYICNEGLDVFCVFKRDQSSFGELSTDFSSLPLVSRPTGPRGTPRRYRVGAAMFSRVIVHKNIPVSSETLAYRFSFGGEGGLVR
jgi:hypothetical protein